LERFIYLVEIEHYWSGAQSAPAFDIDRRVGRAHLDAVEVFCRADRPDRAGNLPKAIFEAASRKGINTLGRHLPCQILTEIAVNCVIDLSLIAKCERYSLHVHCRYDCAN